MLTPDRFSRISPQDDSSARPLPGQRPGSWLALDLRSAAASTIASSSCACRSHVYCSAAARANRERFIRIARERGRCRMLHEKHSSLDVILKNVIAMTRLWIAQLTGAGIARIAREERRLAIARGMFDGLAG